MTALITHKGAVGSSRRPGLLSLRGSTGQAWLTGPTGARIRARLLDGLESALAFVLIVGVAASWATHILTCVLHELWGLLVVGLLLVPVAILHGLAVLASLAG